MASIDNMSIEGFKALFTEFPFLPLYKATQIYFIGDIVYIEPNFYESTIDDNSSTPPVEGWKAYKDNVLNYVSDSDITRAFSEAKINFNPSLFPDDETALLVFYYLTAHYLVIDKNNALNPFGLGFMGLTQSKSVGSVSESYGIPQWVLNDAILGSYAQTGYGRKYLSLIMPYLKGNIIYTPGAINFG